MKKLFLSMMLTLACLLGASAQTLTVCDGEATNEYQPIYGYNYDVLNQYSHMIYPASMLSDMAGRTITSVTFYATSAIQFSGGTQSLAVKEVEETSINTKVTDGTEVFNGTFAIDGDKLVITFDDGFEYDGGNLMLITKVVAKGTYKDTEFYGIESTGSSMHYNWSASIDNFLPKATFTYEGEPAEYAVRIDKNEIAFGTVPSNNLPKTENVRITNKGINAITPTVSINGAAFTTTYQATTLAKNEYVDIPVVFNAEQSETAYEGTMTITAYDGEGGLITVSLNGTVGEPVYEVTVADGNQTNNYIPLYSLYWDTMNAMSQVIYKKSDLANIVGKEITSITYYPQTAITLNTDGEATISFGTTTSDTFDSATPFDGTRVATWKPTSDGGLFVELDEPYLYDGAANLVVDFRVTTNSATYQTPAVPFIGVQTGGTNYVSIYKYSGSTYYRSTFTPKTTFGYRDVEQPVEYTITMTPEPGTFDGPQTVLVTVEPEMPEGASIKYTFEAGHREAEEMDYNDSGIEITQSGLLTIIVRDATGAELASTEGEYTINGSTTAIEAISGKAVAGVRYYNVAGVASDKAFDGVNIVVTTYTDGTQHVTKIVK